MNRIKQYCVLLLCLFSLYAKAQIADEELAANFLSNKEYVKAADMYEKLLSKNPKSVYYYDNLLKSYIATNDLDAAAKAVKKQGRRFEQNYYYQVDVGYILSLQGANDKAKQVFVGLIDKMKPMDYQIVELSMAFQKRNEINYAIETFLKGRNLLKSETRFASELGGLYADKHEPKEMIDEHLNVLVENESSQSEVQGFLQNNLRDNAEYDLLKQALVKKTRQYPERSTFPEMLIWLFVQKGDYDQALVYAKAIDKRHKEEGRRLVDLGFMATANGKYDAAVSIFKQVEAMGKDNPFYSLAKNSETEARAKKVLSGEYSQMDLVALDQEYTALLNEFGRNPATAETIYELANLQAFYENKFDSAIYNYQSLIDMNRLDRQMQARCKLELGDLYVLKNEVWDAMLLYGQVDKDFMEEPLGQEAKFRNAQLSYYLGEFEWAKAQLDVLKTATTQLIANNALELSLLIQDNTVDSVEDALNMFARADLNFKQGNNKKAMELLDSIQIAFPKHALADDILYKKAEIFAKKRDYATSVKYYKQVVDEYGSDILGDNALYKWAKLTQNQLNQPEEAKKLYERFINEYSGSFFLTDCRKQFRFLRGDIIN